MSWTEIKKALNSTLGTEEFKPLDKIIENALLATRENIEVNLDDAFTSPYIQSINKFPTTNLKTIDEIKILRPTNLEPQYILKGVTIAGCEGEYSLKNSIIINYRNAPSGTTIFYGYYDEFEVNAENLTRASIEGTGTYVIDRLDDLSSTDILFKGIPTALNFEEDYYIDYSPIEFNGTTYTYARSVPNGGYGSNSFVVDVTF